MKIVLQMMSKVLMNNLVSSTSKERSEK